MQCLIFICRKNDQIRVRENDVLHRWVQPSGKEGHSHRWSIVQYKLTPALEKDLADCYRNTLDMCQEYGLKSVAFCCISTGVFRFPNRRAAEIAVETVTSWMSEHPEEMERVIFNVFKEEDRAIYEDLLS